MCIAPDETNIIFLLVVGAKAPNMFGAKPFPNPNATSTRKSSNIFVPNVFKE